MSDEIQTDRSAFDPSEDLTDAGWRLPDSPAHTKILFVDDEQAVLDGIARKLRRFLKIDTAQSGERALELLKSSAPYAVVVSDMEMPGMNGAQFLRKAQVVSPDTVRLMLTGHDNRDTAVEAVNQGHVYQFLSKPCPTRELLLALKGAINEYRLIMSERVLLEKTLNGSIDMLTEMLAAMRPGLFNRGQRLKEYVTSYLEQFPVEKSWELQIAATLCPIGFMTLPEGLNGRICAGRSLNAHESKAVEQVPDFTAELLAKIPRLEPVAKIVRYHKYRYEDKDPSDPEVSESRLPFGSRLLKILSDLIDLEAKGKTKAEALDLMKTRNGWYDPRILNAMIPWVRSHLEPAPAREAVTVEALEMGRKFEEPVLSQSGEVIVPAGVRLTPFTLKRILNVHRLEGVVEPLHVSA